MPQLKPLKPTIVFRSGYWRVREPIPRPYGTPAAQRWHAAHAYLCWLNAQSFALEMRDRFWKARDAREKAQRAV